MNELLKSLDCMIAQSPDEKPFKTEFKNKAIIGQFFKALKRVKEDRKKGCVVRDSAEEGSHLSSVVTELTARNSDEFPEVLTLNLTWSERNPHPNAVLKTLISIPEKF